MKDRGTVIRVGIGNADVRVGSTLLRGLPVSGFDYSNLVAGDRVSLSWKGERAYVSGLLDYRETADGTPVSVATAATEGAETVIETRVEDIYITDDGGGSANADADSEILFSSGSGITITAAGHTVTTMHSSGDIGDVHTNYAEPATAETITADWLWGTTKKTQYRDAAIYIGSVSADGQLDIVADGEVQIDTSVLDINATGGVTVSHALLVSGDVGIAVASPARALEVADNAAAQLRLTHTVGSVYVDLRATATGSLLISCNPAADLELDMDIEFQGSQSIKTSADHLTLAPANELIIDPAGNIARIMADTLVKTDNYASQTTGWGIDYTGGADFRYLFADEMHVKSFVADLEQALAGGQIICKSVAVLSRDFTAPAAGRATTLYVWDLPSAEGMAAFVSGDIVRLRSFSRAGGSLTVSDCWGVVTVYTDLSNKEQSWTFTRSAAPNAGAMAGGATVYADAIILDYGRTGNGFYEVNAIDGVYGLNSPYAQIVTWTTHPHSGQSVRTRFGNLRGITSQAEYGILAGSGVGLTDQYIRASSYAFEVHNIDLTMYDGSNTTIKLDRTTPYIAVGATAPTAYLTGDGFWVGKHSGVYKLHIGDVDAERLQWDGTNLALYDSNANVAMTVGGSGNWISMLMMSPSLGDTLFSASYGIALWGPGCEISSTVWTTAQDQDIVITGTFTEVLGRWAGTRALKVTTNTTAHADALASELNGNGTWSIRTIVQAPFAYDSASWPGQYNYVFDIADDGGTDRTFLMYDAVDNRFELYIQGGYRINTDGSHQFAAGDWLDIMCEYHFTSDLYYLYIDGVLAGSDTTALSTPTAFDKIAFGSRYSNTSGAGWAFAEIAFFDGLPNAERVAAMYALQRPLIDMGATLTPGLYILDGRVRIASSTSGVRLDLTSSALAIGNGISYGGVGCWVGLDGGTPKFSVGDGSTKYLKWNGTYLTWKGTNSELNSSGNLVCTGGTIGGWTIGATTLANSTNIVLDAGSKAISIKSSSFGSDGIQIQYNGGSPRLYVGDGGSNYLKYTTGSMEIRTGSGAIKLTSAANILFHVASANQGLAWYAASDFTTLCGALRVNTSTEDFYIDTGGGGDADWKDFYIQNLSSGGTRNPLFIDAASRIVSFYDTSPQTATVYINNEGDSQPALWVHQPSTVSSAVLRLQTEHASGIYINFNGAYSGPKTRTQSPDAVYDAADFPTYTDTYSSIKCYIEGVGTKYLRLYNSA